MPVRNLLCSELLLLALLFGCFPLVSGVGGGGGSSYEPKESIGYSNVVERAESLNCSERFLFLLAMRQLLPERTTFSPWKTMPEGAGTSMLPQ